MGGKRLVLDDQGRKRCPVCKEYKPLSAYPPYVGRKFGVASHCKKCYAAHQSTKYDLEKYRIFHLQHKYGISVDEYQQMLDAQNGVCSSCGDTEVRRAGRSRCTENITPRLHVDHDHETGKVRGLLCSNCNTALGLLRSDPLRIKLLLKYIEEHIT